jgi:hypothetical protein
MERKRHNTVDVNPFIQFLDRKEFNRKISQSKKTNLNAS